MKPSQQAVNNFWKALSPALERLIQKEMKQNEDRKTA